MSIITREQVVEVAQECGASVGLKVITDIDGDGTFFIPEDLQAFAQHFYDLGREAGENTAENAECKYVAGLEAENARLKAEREDQNDVIGKAIEHNLDTIGKQGAKILGLEAENARLKAEREEAEKRSINVEAENAALTKKLDKVFNNL